jgi:hypothetical protein
MPNDHRPTPTFDGRSRRYLVVGALLALLTTGVAAFLITRDGGSAAMSSPATASSGPAPVNTTTTTIDLETEVTARLKEILQVRERAFLERDASLFDDVYTSDCSCLRAGQDAIAALKRENVLWKDRSISVQIQSAKSLNDRLWEVVALFISDSFRIETEQGVLVRQAPAERLRYRFLLVRTSEEAPWRLGSASLVEGS